MDKLDDYFKAYNNIDEKTPNDIFYMKPEELVNQRRIDIIVKYYYIKARETGENLELARDMYEKHIEAFSDGTFEEQGNSEKDSIEKYFEVFDSLIEDFKERGFDENLSIIPVGTNREILDGSHRVACALYFKKTVKVIKFEHLSVDYGFDFFRKRLLDDFYLDFIAKEYINLKKDVYAFFIWPRIGTRENAKYVEESLEKDVFNIIYKKKLTLNKLGLWNLVFNIYKDEFWLGSPNNNFKGVGEKSEICYSEDGHLYVYILDCLSVDNLTQKKAKLREYFGVGNSSIHTFDTPEESIQILELVLDKDYDETLYRNFLETKEADYTVIKAFRRKLRNIYRRMVNKIKKIIGKPV